MYKFNELHHLFANFSLSDLAIIRPDIFSSEGANTIYRNLIHGLIKCSVDCFSQKSTNKNYRKNWWWDNDLRELKSQSLSACNTWKAEGCKPDTQSFLLYKSAKNDFRNLVRKKKKNASQTLNENLIYSLDTSKAQKFWKLWDANFKIKNNN